MMTTHFAPAARVDRDQLIRQVKSISHSPVMNAILQTSAGLMVVLNENRQIVAYNHSFLQSIGISAPEKVLGLRLGESLHCVHAHEEPGGCGTTVSCSSCGAALAIMAAIDDDTTNERICSLRGQSNGHSEDICLLVKAQPFRINHRRWILVYARDISQQQFWASMEDLFFHDINNLLASLKIVSDYIGDTMPHDQLVGELRMITERVCKEISMQRTLSHYKDRRSIVNLSPTTPGFIREQVLKTVLSKSLAEGKTLVREGGGSDGVTFVTDPLLVARVLVNMLLNALEATPPGGNVTFRTIVEPARIRWEVWNSAPIPANIQPRIFQKFFSTKKLPGHGLGTYSMKLFGEECLGGEVGFTSSVEGGTTFFFSLPRTTQGTADAGPNGE
jgi:signal transduction histidine kinase